MKKGGEATNGKAYFCADSVAKSIEEIANEYHNITGEKISLEPLSVKEGAELTSKDLKAHESLAKELEDTFTFVDFPFSVFLPLTPSDDLVPTLPWSRRR